MMKNYKFVTAAVAAVILFTIVLCVGIATSRKKPEHDNSITSPAKTSENVPGESIFTGQESYILYIDSEKMSANLNAVIMPLKASERTLAFSSSDENIVTVSADGIITAKGTVGSATIYISGGRDKNGKELYKECSVEVRRGVTGITLSSNDLSFYADRPETAALKATVVPEEATNKEVIWSSSNTAVAGVDENGNVSICGAGTAKVTATTVDGGFKAECVIRSRVYNITVKGVFITNPVEAIPTGTEYALTSYVYPENAIDKTISWESSNPEIVSVDANGVLRANAEGYAVITLRAANGREDYFTIMSTVHNEGLFEYKPIAAPLEERIAALSVPVNYSRYSASYDSAVNTQLRQNPVVFVAGSHAASKNAVERYLNPNGSMKGAPKYQYLDLSQVSGVDARMLDVYLSDKGVLKGKGQAFRAAAEVYGVNAAYLAIHACLESGNGTSELASGMNYNGTTVYNLFGIGAFDADPVNGGAKYAHDMGWFDVESAIYGGAKWISENYINAGQNTLYKMRWNPEKPGTHQYATDVAWAEKQAQTLQTFMEVFPISDLVFDVPVYSGEEEPQMRYE